MFGVYRQPVHYQSPQLFRRQNFEPAELRWLLNRGTEKYATATVGTSYAANSFFDDTNSVLGNVAVFAKTFSPSAVEVFADGDGIPYPASPVVGRQSVTFREYQPASRTYVSVTGAVDGITATLYFNNQTPAAVGTIPDQQAYTNVAYEGPILDDYITDGENDPIVWSSVGDALPTGVTIQTVTVNVGLPSERIVQRPRGTPATGQQSTKAITLRGTDIVGAFVDRSFALVTGIGQLVPDVDNGTTPLQTGLDLIAAALPTSPFSLRYIDDVVAEGNIVNTFPPGGTYVIPGTPISLDVSGVVVPTFLGIDQVTVLASLQARGFTVITVEASSGYPAGAVFQLTESEIALTAGDILPAGSTITMHVASGDDPLPEPGTTSAVDQIVFRFPRGSTLNEESSLSLQVYFRLSGDFVLPSTVHYSLRCQTTGTVLVQRTAITPASPLTLGFGSALQAIINPNNAYETKIVTIWTDYGLSTQQTAEQRYRVKNLGGIGDATDSESSDYGE